MLTRRRFIASTAAASAAAVAPSAAVAGTGLAATETPAILYVNTAQDGTLTLDMTWEEAVDEYSSLAWTWRDYLEDISPGSEGRYPLEAFRELWREFGEIPRDLDEVAPESVQERAEEYWQEECCPMNLATDYLEELGVFDGGASGAPLEGVGWMQAMGSWTREAFCRDAGAAAALQERLIELGETTIVKVA